jgi:hypothetical protein
MILTDLMMSAKSFTAKAIGAFPYIGDIIGITPIVSTLAFHINETTRNFSHHFSLLSHNQGQGEQPRDIDTCGEFD